MTTGLLPASGNELEQILFLDNFYYRVDLDDPQFIAVENWLINTVSTAVNAYTKRASIRILYELYLMNKLANPYALKGILWPFLTNTGEPLVTSLCIRLFVHIADAHPDHFVEKLKELADHDQADISLAALESLGNIHLIKAQYVAGFREKVIANLAEAEKYFSEGAVITENSIDAHLANGLVNIMVACSSGDVPAAKAALDGMKALLLYKHVYEYEGKYMEFASLVWKAASNIYAIIEKLDVVGRWVDFSAEFRHLLRLQNKAALFRGIDPTNQMAFVKIYNSVIDASLDILYGFKLNGHEQRIDALLEGADQSDLIAFLTKVKQTLPDSIIGEDLGLLAKLVKEYGDIRGVALYGQVKGNSVKIVGALANLPSNSRNSLSRFITGNVIGQDVYTTLREEIEKLLPDFSPKKMQIYFAIMEELIRYTQRSIAGSSKSEFQFLYAKSEHGKGQEAVEADLQDHLYNYLLLTDIAYGFEHEKAKFVDGGRVDIVFKNDEMTVPIELKKTLRRSTPTSIEDDYIGQAQTYVTGYDQLGIFVLLDLSATATSVSVNFKDLFHIHHLSPNTAMPVKYPDYIISVIIPGNKVLPSQKSTYR